MRTKYIINRHRTNFHFHTNNLDDSQNKPNYETPLRKIRTLCLRPPIILAAQVRKCVRTHIACARVYRGTQQQQYKKKSSSSRWPGLDSGYSRKLDRLANCFTSHMRYTNREHTTHTRTHTSFSPHMCVERGAHHIAN